MASYRIDPELADVAAQIPARDLADLEPTRKAVAAAAVAFPVDASGVDVTEQVIPGDVPVRVYRPAAASAGLTGAILHAHGGGFVMCDLESSHRRNIELVRGLGVPLVSVDYRLAPEHPFPAGSDDVYAALRWLAASAPDLGVDPERIVLHGVSAGAALVAGVAQRARDERQAGDDAVPVPCFQYLSIPVTDDRQQTPSLRRFADTPMWDRGKAAFSWDAYLGAGVPGSADVSPYAAPLRGAETPAGLAGLPPAYISVMEFDPLRDEGLAYAQALLAAGVTVEVHLFPGTFHGSSGAVPGAAITQRDRAEELAVLAAALDRS